MDKTADIRTSPPLSPETQPVRSASSLPMPKLRLFHVPDMHCAACMTNIEQRLAALPEIDSARVNLTLKQVAVHTAPDTPSQQLIDALKEAGFAATEIDPEQQPLQTDKQAQTLLLRVAVAGFGMMNVMLLSIAVWSGAEAATGQLLHLVSALIALPVLVYSAQPFFANALTALSARRLNMDVPIALAILLASVNSLYTALVGGHHVYFDAALALTFFLLAGRYLDARTRSKARSAAAQLATLQATRAVKINNAALLTVDAATLKPGDIILVRPGDSIPADGIVKHGQSESDRAFLTGESVPVALEPETRVFAGETNLNGSLEIEVTAVKDDSLLQQFIALVGAMENTRNRYTSLADRAAAFYAPVVHITALAAFVFWMLTAGDFRFSLDVAIAVLIITCPCALGLAVPAVMTVAGSRFFARGVLLKTATALERLAEIDTILFDKTGTLTSGRFTADHLDKVPESERAVLHTLAAASNHPYASAIAEALAQKPLAASLEAITETPGKGMSAQHNGVTIRLGKPEWVDPDGSAEANFRGIAFRIGAGKTHPLPVEEDIRPGIAELCKQLDRAGYQRAMLTGDNDAAGSKVARLLGFDDFHCAMTPEEKADHIASLQSSGAKVLMIGDGINDTAAMTRATLSLAPASALDATRSTADVVLLDDNLDALPYLLRAAKTAKKRILQNFAAAAIYNLIAVPIAFAGLATPLLAAVAMSLSSITVSLNALRIKGEERPAKVPR